MGKTRTQVKSATQLNLGRQGRHSGSHSHILHKMPHHERQQYKMNIVMIAMPFQPTANTEDPQDAEDP